MRSLLVFLFVCIVSIASGQKIYFQANYSKDTTQEVFSYDNTYVVLDVDNKKMYFRVENDEVYAVFDVESISKEDTEDYIVVTVVISSGVSVVFHESKYFDFCSMRTRTKLYRGTCGRKE